MKKLGKIIQYLILFLLSSCLIFFLVLFSVRESSKTFLEEKTIDTLVKKINLTELMMNQVGEYTVKGKDIHDLIAKTGIPEEAIEDFLESEATKDLMIDYTKMSLDYLVDGKELPELKSDEVLTTFEASLKEVILVAQEQKLPYADQLTEEQQKKIMEKAEETVPKIIERIPTAEALLIDELQKRTDLNEKLASLKQAQANVQTLRDQLKFFFSNQVTYLFLGGLLVLASLIIFVRFSKTAWMLWLGFSLSIAGIGSILIGTFLSTIVHFLHPIPPSLEGLASEIFTLFSKPMIDLSFFFLIPGLLLILFFAFFHFLQIKKENQAYEQM